MIRDRSEIHRGHSAQICFLGGLFDHVRAADIEGASLGNFQVAANTLQWLIVDGLETNQPGTVTIVTAPFVGSFPTRYRYPLVKGWKFSHGEGSRDESIGFLNLPIVKHFSRTWGLRRALRSWIRRTPGKKIVIAYSLNSSFLNCLALARSLDEDVVTCIVVPDLPQYMNTSMTESRAYRVLKRVDNSIIRHYFHAADSLVLLTESMRERLPPGPPHIVVEGIARADGLTPRITNTNNGSRVIMYAGTLNARYGIARLLEAFASIDDAHLWLIVCGEGDSEDIVRQSAAADHRIRFLGRVSHSKVLELQMEATILVNPRQNDEEFAKYSFPSKILEYMSVGRPIIAYELDGMPREYRDYLTYVPGRDAASLADSIRRLCELSDDELDAMGAKSQKYVQQYKNPCIQARRILDLVSKQGTG